MGRMLKKVDFVKQPLATFNHIFAINALESISERQIPLYVRVEDGEFFTELVGGGYSKYFTKRRIWGSACGKKSANP